MCAIERIYYACPFNKFCALFTGFCARQTAHTHTLTHNHTPTYTGNRFSHPGIYSFPTQSFISHLSSLFFFLAQQLKHFLKVTNTHAFVNLYEKGIVAAMASKNSKIKKKPKKKREIQKNEAQDLNPARMLAANPYWQQHFRFGSQNSCERHKLNSCATNLFQPWCV